MISIIVPVYNVERYLKQALRSLVGQTYTDLQIICIDDGSTDGSLSILQGFAQADSRVEIHSQRNMGLSGARNAGLGYVKGEYLMFLDPDDWMELDTCEKALELMQGENADLVFWGYVKEYEDRSEWVQVWSQQREFEGDAMPILRRRLLGMTAQELAHPEWMDSLGTAWGKLYRSDIFQQYHIRYVDTAEIGSAEDVLANLYYLAHSHKAIYTPDIVYHYRKTNVSALTKTYKPRLKQQWQRLFAYMREWATEFDSSAEAFEVLGNRIAHAVISLGLNELSSAGSKLDQMRRVSRILSAEWYRKAVKNLDLSYMPVHWKAFFFCAKHRMTWGVYALLCIIHRILHQ